jgi:hypothetical protein
MIPNVQHHSQKVTEIQQNFISKFHHRKSTEMQRLTLALTWGVGGGRDYNLELVCTVHFAEI